MSWWKNLKGSVKRNEPLKYHTSFKIGGPPEFFIEPRDTGDLKLAMRYAKERKIPIAVIGAGTNVLVADKGMKGIVVRLSAPFFKKISFHKERLEAGAGAQLQRIVSGAQKRGLGGLEFFTGIPGTVGGALAMNAGVSEKAAGNTVKTRAFADSVEKITVMDYKGSVFRVSKKDFAFGYRTSGLAEYVVLSVGLKLKKERTIEISRRMKKYGDRRKRTQDYTLPSAGCVFKNPYGRSAGELIDLLGQKGRRVGDACVSHAHANFIVNLGCAKARDVLKLMDAIQKEVKNKFNISLEPEIKIWS